MIILKIWLLGSLSYPIFDLRNRRSHARRGYYLRGSLIIMQDEAKPTDTAPSQKRDTPEDADTGHTAQEPERRVRPRETPVGPAAAAAPEPEEGASAKAQSEDSNNCDDADEAKDDEEGAEPPAPPRTAVRYWQIRDGEAHGDPSTNPFLALRREPAPGTPIDDNTPPDPWVREEFEVETGRVVHQETIEGKTPDTESRALEG